MCFVLFSKNRRGTAGRSQLTISTDITRVKPTAMYATAVRDSCGDIIASARRSAGVLTGAGPRPIAGRDAYANSTSRLQFRRSADHSRRASCGTAKMANGFGHSPHSYARCSSALIRRSARG